MMHPSTMHPSDLITELHAAGYSNAAIGYLLSEYGASRAISERTVRRWALGHTEPRLSDAIALRALYVAVIAIGQNRR